jgi:hypothetical protein
MSQELYAYHMQHTDTCKKYLNFCFQKMYDGQDLSLDEQGLKQLCLAYLNLIELYVLKGKVFAKPPVEEENVE